MPDQTHDLQVGPGPTRMGPVSRFFGIITSPGRVFDHLQQRPSWLVILLLVAACVAALNISFMSTETGRGLARNAIEEQIRSRGLTLSEEQIDQQVKIQRIAAPILTFLWFPILSLILTTLVYLIFNVFLGGDGTFRKVLSITSHVFPVLALQAVLTTVLILMKESIYANTSFAVFVPFLEEGSLGYMILRGIDLFFIWAVGLLALGMSRIYGFSGSKCAQVLFGTYLGLVVVIALVRNLLS